MTSINVYKIKMFKEREVIVDFDTRITSPEVAVKIILEAFDLEHEAVENFGMLALDTKNGIAGAHILGIGTINAAIASPREVFKAALLNNATSVILFHNHPSGDPTPSSEDMTMTARMMEVGEMLGIEVLDHIIIGEYGRAYSIKANEMI